MKIFTTVSVKSNSPECHNVTSGVTLEESFEKCFEQLKGIMIEQIERDNDFELSYYHNELRLKVDDGTEDELVISIHEQNLEAESAVTD